MKNRTWFCVGVMLATVLVSAAAVWALPPNSAEIDAARRTAARWFDGASASESAPAASVFVEQNYNPLRINYGHGGKIRIGETVYERGLFCHAASDLIIRLPSPGKTFRAEVGVDNNLTYGNGTVVFQVTGENIAWESPICRGAEAPRPVEVALGGQTEFHLVVSPTEDGISHDQANWAEAQVELENGEIVWLDGLPIIEKQTPAEMADYPFSFVYDGKSSREFLKNWKLDRSTETIERDKTRRTLVFRSDDGLLEARCVAVTYADYPHMEWTLYFKNIGDKETAILEKINALDTAFIKPEWSDFTIHHPFGSAAQKNDYLPRTTTLAAGQTLRSAGGEGKPSKRDWPYFNIETTPGSGLILAVGWPGQWASSMTAQEDGTLAVVAGQETFHAALRPGEEVRSPLIVVQPWYEPGWIAAQNVWRSWMLDYNVPRGADGSVVASQMGGCSSHWFVEMGTADTQCQLQFIDRYIEEKIRLDYWWMDAGWYPCGGSWPNTGTWEPDMKRFPKGLAEINAYLKERGRYNVVWFEPERVAPHTWLSDEHPEWCANGKEGGLLNLADPDALDWVIEHFNRFVTEQQVGLYRQDFNIDPLSAWQKWDGNDPKRQGMTENAHVVGYLKFWDSLLDRHPGLRIDSCASGGMRNDLESMRRAVPLHRSDYILEPTGQQNHTFGLSFWIPIHGSCHRAVCDYDFRSCHFPCVNLLYDMRDSKLPYDLVRRNIQKWENWVAPYYTGDFYPLCAACEAEDVWVGWEFWSPEKQKGVIQMFRRADSDYVKGQFRLGGLVRDAVYTVTWRSSSWASCRTEK